MEFRKFYGRQPRGATRRGRATATGSNSTATGDSHGRQPRATATGDSHGRQPRATATGDSHGRQPRATGPGDGAGRRGRATGPGDGAGRQPRATATGDGAGRRGRATGSNSTAQKRGAGITGPFVTIGLADIGDKFVVSAFHAKPRKDRTTDNLVKFVMDVNNLATLIADKIGKIVTIQAKVITLQFVIEGIDGMT